MEDIEPVLSRYEQQHYGTSRVQQYLSAQRAKLGAPSGRQRIEASPFFESRDVAGIDVLNAFETVFRVESASGIHIAKICNSRHDEIRINQILSAAHAGFVAPMLAADDAGIAVFARCEPLFDEAALEGDYAELQRNMERAAELLAEIHALSPEGMPRSQLKVPINRFSRLTLAEYAQLPGFEIQRYLEAAQSLQVSLAYAESAQGTCFIHGDFKFDNIMCHAGRLVAIDWETAGQGRREADLGTFLGCLATLWLKDKSRSYDGSIRGILNRGDIGLVRCVMLMDRFLSTYATHLPGRIDIHLLVLYAGKFLMDRGLVANLLGGRFNLETSLCFGLGQALIRSPLRMAALCKGLIQHELEHRHYG